MNPSFERYIGIDYSGAQTPSSSLKGLRVYAADHLTAPQEVMPPPSPREYWTRRGIAEWLVERLSEGQHNCRKISTIPSMATRAERRAAAREAAKLLLRQPSKKQGFRWDITLALVVAILAVLLAFLPPQDAVTTGFWLAAIFCLGIYPALHFSDWVFRSQRKWIVRGIAVTIWGAAVLAFGVRMWPPIPYYHKLTAKEKDAFMAILRSQKETHETLIIRCPNADEKLCVTATDFLEMFQRAGWKTPTGGIERGVYAKAVTGISIAKKPAPGTVDPNNPDMGLWVLQSPSLMTIKKAFDSIGMTTIRQAGQDLDDGVIAIYFGPAP
jgi:hypothetical protein